ncbi:MAG: MBL fold metallo-hydrolase [Candidatus Asgardarchaeia archaeon]
MKLTFLGGAGEVGRSAVLLDSNGYRTMIDYGIKVYEKGPAQLPLVPKKGVHEILISHAHLDHIGFLPMLYAKGRPKWYGTPPTHALGELLIADAMKVQELNGFENPFTEYDFEKSMHYFEAMEYEEEFKLKNGGKASFYDAGHILGAASIIVEVEGKKILYTGDFNLTETRMHGPATFKEDVDIIITESTYAVKEHPSREAEEKRLIDHVKEALDFGGSALVPVFAVGRAQEVAVILNDAFPDERIYMDGMALKASDIYLRFPEYLKDAKTLHEALHRIKAVKRKSLRYKIVKGGSIIISPAGMLNGGNALWYLQNLPEYSTVTLTGYCAEGTNGWMLLNKGVIEKEGKLKRINLSVKQVDLSAHAGRKDLWEMIERVSPELVIVMHGDECFTFADQLNDEGFNAIAPRMGETIPV